MSPQYKTLLYAIIMSVISGSCTVLNQPPNETNTSHTVSGTEDNITGQLAAMRAAQNLDMTWVFQYYRLISTVPSNVLDDEFERTKRDFSAKKTERNQWQFALLLSIPASAFYNPGQASILFKELAEPAAEQDSVTNDAAFLMYSLTRKSAMLEERLTESQAANNKLQVQLDGLKDIEKNLYQRNKVEEMPNP